MSFQDLLDLYEILPFHLSQNSINELRGALTKLWGALTEFRVPSR